MKNESSLWKKTLIHGLPVITLIVMIALSIASCGAKTTLSTDQAPDNSSPAQSGVKPVEQPSAIFSDLKILPPQADTGEAVTISAIVANSNGVAGNIDVGLNINGAAREKKTIQFTGNNQYTLEFTVTEDEAGVYTVEIGGLTGKLTVISPSDFVASDLYIPEKIVSGEPLSISSTLTNNGKIYADYNAGLLIDGKVAYAQSVSLAPGESKQVVFDLSEKAPGDYTVELGGLTGRFTIEPELRLWVLTDADVTRLYDAFKFGTLTVHFLPGNHVIISLGIMHGNVDIAVVEGKLVSYPIDPEVYEGMPKIKPYVFYIKDPATNTDVAYLSYTWFDPSEEIAPDVTELPIMVSVTTEEGQANVIYEWPPRK